MLDPASARVTCTATASAGIAVYCSAQSSTAYWEGGPPKPGGMPPPGPPAPNISWNFSNTRMTCRCGERKAQQPGESKDGMGEGLTSRAVEGAHPSLRAGCGGLGAHKQPAAESVKTLAVPPGAMSAVPRGAGTAILLCSTTHLGVVLVVEDGHRVLGGLSNGGHHLWRQSSKEREEEASVTLNKVLY